MDFRDDPSHPRHPRSYVFYLELLDEKLDTESIRPHQHQLLLTLEDTVLGANLEAIADLEVASKDKVPRCHILIVVVYSAFISTWAAP